MFENPELREYVEQLDIVDEPVPEPTVEELMADLPLSRPDPAEVMRELEEILNLRRTDADAGAPAEQRPRPTPPAPSPSAEERGSSGRASGSPLLGRGRRARGPSMTLRLSRGVTDVSC